MSTTRHKRTVQDLLSKAGVEIDGSQPWDILVHDDRVYRAVLTRGSLGLGEAYVDGWWDVQRLDQFICKVLRANLIQYVNPGLSQTVRYLKSAIFNMQSRRRAKKAVEHHYDIGQELYMSFLDPYNQYSCGYFKNTGNLDTAQKQKLDLICRKLCLTKKDKVLDIGCGWGGLAKFAASRYGCHVTGITLSQDQYAYAKEFCEGLPVEICLKDYRDIDVEFDKIVSVGMFEHVGPKNYRTMMEVVRRCLAPDGLFLLHTIGGNTSTFSTDQWLAKYIFPNSVLPSVQQISEAIEGLFVLEDWHNFGVYYAKTLRAWMENFDRNWEKLRKKYDERFYRMWKYYLLSCAGTFDARYNQLWQIVLSPRGEPGGYERKV